MAIYPYETEKLVDFSLPENQANFEKGLKTVRSYLGKTYPLIIDGKKVKSGRLLKSINPSLHQEVIGFIHQASKSDVDAAIESALKHFETWKLTDYKMRADILFKAAAILRRRKFEFSALLSLEAGKPWAEADADTAEAIDFLEYYGRSMIDLMEKDKQVLSRDKIERNEYKYMPLGVAAVITPWNFPLAILLGMTAASIVTGNTVLLKPAVTTQVIAYKALEVLKEAGLPDGIIQFIPGDGLEVGEYMVTHPKVRFVSFTGSKAVGVRIYEKAAVVYPGQKWLKRVISEMGGKDAMIIDQDVDLDFAANEVAKAAFSFAGQKCSAASRAIVHEKVYDAFLEKLVKITANFKVGAAELKDTFVGPVNDEKAYSKIVSYIEIGKKEGKLIFGGKADDKVGYFVEPTIIKDLDPSSRIMQEEIFGPVLGVTRFKTFDEALQIANNTEYGLTGSVISNNRENIEKAKTFFEVGNLYINRKCTGAIVGYQPFGGFNMSGTDSKAGGPDYLILHMQAKTISEMF